LNQTIKGKIIVYLAIQNALSGILSFPLNYDGIIIPWNYYNLVHVEELHLYLITFS